MGSCPACSLEVSASCPGPLYRPHPARQRPHLVVNHVRHASCRCALSLSSRIRATPTSTFKITLVIAATTKISSWPTRIDGGTIERSGPGRDGRSGPPRLAASSHQVAGFWWGGVRPTPLLLLSDTRRNKFRGPRFLWSSGCWAARLSMGTANYYREQANLLLSWAAAATDPTIKEQLRKRAQEYLSAADFLEMQSSPPPSLPPRQQPPVVQQQQQAQPPKKGDEN